MTADPIASGLSSPPAPPSTAAGSPADPAAIADALYYSVSHDLRSPLLTMSLSADLITDALERLPESAGGPVAIALDALRHGAKDMERMLQALTLISRARRRALGPSRVSLQVILGGQLVISEVTDLSHVHVAVDPVPVLDIIETLATDGPIEVHARIEGHAVGLECDGPEALEAGTTPLELLVGSLHTHAGTPVEALAAAQVLLERQGGAVECGPARLIVRLPLAEGR